MGLAGLDGSGRTETLETMFGVATRKSGRILLDGKECKNLNPRQSIKNNFALLTEERRATVFSESWTSGRIPSFPVWTGTSGRALSSATSP